MKKAILILSALLLGAAALRAVPAYPYPVKLTQPDGSTITVQLHGDEFYHWATSDGYVVEQDKDGFYRRVNLVQRRSAAPSAAAIREAHAERARRAALLGKRAADMRKGDNRFLVILVEFSDLTFSVNEPQQAFWNLLNQEGYSANGGTGSVRDYYMENSTNQFRPTYDVIGPVKVSKGFAAYGEDIKDSQGNRISDKAAREAFKEACDLANTQGLVNFANYDIDGDGYVDNIFFYYAGHNQAEHGGDDTIWPHASGFSSGSYNGIRLGSYACTSEYRGASGNAMCGIGTFCHEFGHVLGLPDFYDTDYSENGQAEDVYNFSLMSNGPYNNSGRTPPYLGAMERLMLGWGPEPTLWNTPGSKTLKAVTENVSAYTPTSVEDEFFLYEVRTGEGWDKYIDTTMPATGLLVYHVDQSENLVTSGYTARYLWEHTNSINAYSNHPCYYLVSSVPNPGSYYQFPFGGNSGKTEFSDLSKPASVDWSKIATGYNLTDIAYANKQVTLTLTIDKSRKVVGTVTDTKGNPVAGASVTVTDDAEIQSIMGLRSQRHISQRAKKEGTTDASGNYTITIDEGATENLTLTISKSGYRVYTTTFVLKSGGLSKDVVLRDIAEADKVTIKKYNAPSGYGLGFWSTSDPASACAAVGYTAEELAPYVGMKISQINFLVYFEAVEVLEALVEVDGERVCTQQVKNPKYDGKIMEVPLDNPVTIEEGKNIIFGYAFKNLTDVDQTGAPRTPYPFAIDDQENGVSNAGLVYNGYSTTGIKWATAQDGNGRTFNFIIGAVLEDSSSSFYNSGFRVIDNPKPAGYAVGDTFQFALMPSTDPAPASVSWKFDGTDQNDASIVLTAGDHTVEATLVHADGSVERITQVIKVQ